MLELVVEGFLGDHLAQMCPIALWNWLFLAS
jgi:hypothetical protein